jgi:hypothetical protein
MKTKTTHSMGTMVAVAIAAVTISAGAALTGPDYPPPGGVDFSYTGSSAADPGGLTLYFANFDTTKFSQLFWGSAGAVSSRLGVTYGAASELMNFSGAGGPTAEWRGTAYYYNSGNQLVSTETWLKVTAYGAPDFYWTLVPEVGYVLDNSAGKNFSVNLQFLARDSYGSLVALNSIPHEGGSASSFSGGFWYEAATPVPEPATYLAGALLLVPFGARLLRRNRES